MVCIGFQFSPLLACGKASTTIVLSGMNIIVVGLGAFYSSNSSDVVSVALRLVNLTAILRVGLLPNAQRHPRCYRGG